MMSPYLLQRMSQGVRFLIVFLFVTTVSPAVPMTAPQSSPQQQDGYRGASQDVQNDTRVCCGAVLPDSARISERILALPGLRNVGRVSPAVYRGAQPSSEGYTTLKMMGIRTVINIRKKTEKDAVGNAGLEYVEIPVNSFGSLDNDTIKKIISVMTDSSKQPVFIHCRRGKDRTGAVIAAYRMEVDGWSFEQAVEEMQAFGFSRLYYNLKKAVRRYAQDLQNQ
ncbi:MAG: dual specificity protein phosphatase family protein [Nitrospiraceae bacterium]|nr:MAG: dual specificity protein phosphatase family protein [Nitrospiraceae bacterium]